MRARVVAALTLSVLACKPDAVEPPPAPQIIGGAGGTARSGDGRLSMTLPAGAVASDLGITVQAMAAAPAGAVGTAFEIGPSGTQFLTPATVTLSYDVASLGGRSEGEVTLATFVDGSWQELDSITRDLAQHTLSGQTMHLSIFGMARPQDDEWVCTGLCPPRKYPRWVECQNAFCGNSKATLCTSYTTIHSGLSVCGSTCPPEFAVVSRWAFAWCAVNCAWDETTNAVGCERLCGGPGQKPCGTDGGNPDAGAPDASVPTCADNGCQGCCDAFDVCQPGTEKGACGAGGAACSDCATVGAVPHSCVNQACARILCHLPAVSCSFPSGTCGSGTRTLICDDGVARTLVCSGPSDCSASYGCTCGGVAVSGEIACESSTEGFRGDPSCGTVVSPGGACLVNVDCLSGHCQAGTCL